MKEEDYATGLRQQRALESGARKKVLFGRNEGGAQNFHRWLDRILATPDADLDRLFAKRPRVNFRGDGSALRGYNLPDRADLDQGPG